MPENILVVEYEPRYTDRVRQALAGQPFTTIFARDGEEAMKALDGDQPRLIVLSSVVPKVSTTELIRAIRNRKPLQDTPILLTVSGYNGKSPKADAQRVGASDILPKPYSETEFLGKIQQMLGVRGDGPAANGAQFTSTEIFGDLTDDDRPAVKKTTASRATGNVDQMLADTLAGLNVPRRREAPAAPAQPAAPAPAPAPAPAAPPAQNAKPRNSTSADIDKRLQDTLSGLDVTARRTTSGGNVPVPPPAVARPVAPAPPQNVVPPSAPAAAPAAPRFNTEKMQAYVPDRVPVAQPVLTPAPAPVPVPAPTKPEEEETTDGLKFGQYVLIEKIATGGMAEVWKARMRGVEGFQKIVAIKKILPHLSDNQDFIEMFVDEAKLAAQLNHNNITHIYDLGKIQNSYYIAMEYIDGFDLKTILRQGQERDNPMSVELALFIASKIAFALDYAHRKKDFEEKEMGLVHRDVSPQNVLISQEGDIKLCDFGIAKAASKASHTQAGALKGKLQYMAPEQAWGRNIDRRSDIFALATVLFEMLTGQKLFSGDNELSILEQVREARVQPPSLYNDEVTPEIDKIVLKALQKDPASRYQTAGEMARDLDAILYSFRPTPTSADLAIYMHRLSSDEPVPTEPEPEPFEEAATAPSPFGAAPVLAPAPAPVIAAAAPAAMAAPMMAAAPAPAAAVAYDAAPETAAEPKSKTGLIAAAAALLALVGIGAFFAMRKPADAAAPAATGSVAAAASPAAPAAISTAPIADPGLVVPGAAITATTATNAPIDPNAVNAEVQKRIAAERARLEALARAQQAATPSAVPAAAPPVRPAPAPAEQVAQQQPVTPPPAAVATVAEQRPAPPPVQEPVRQPEPAAPAPAQAQPAAQRAREGELIAPGTEGLAAPRLLRRGTVPYPAMARAQKIEGTVITNVLVSETGAVLDVRVVRGVSRPVGLNEAAVSAMRRSSFAAGTKDGVRVKSWITVPVEFKL